MYRITYVYRGLGGLLRIGGLKTSPSTPTGGTGAPGVPWHTLGHPVVPRCQGYPRGTSRDLQGYLWEYTRSKLFTRRAYPFSPGVPQGALGYSKVRTTGYPGGSPGVARGTPRYPGAPGGRIFLLLCGFSHSRVDFPTQFVSLFLLHACSHQVMTFPLMW